MDAHRSVSNAGEYRRRVYGGWLGKTVGGTLGEPVEGREGPLDLEFYPDLPDDGGPLPNDDLDLQLVWLHALESYGPQLDASDLAREWVDHVFFPYDEYGYALANLRRGLEPPVAGRFDNPFVDCMGAPIRSEIWAMVAPGRPPIATDYAARDAVVDHAGGEGVHGEVFNAALQSAAFLEDDPRTLVEVGLDAVPPESRVHAAVSDVLAWHDEGIDWTTARERVLDRHGRENFTDAPQNVAFTIVGWLWGDSPADAMLTAVNCGRDTDCTGATLGAILGILGGPEAFADEWVAPVGDEVVVSPAVNGFPAPADLDELADRTVRAGRAVLAHRDATPSLSTDRETAVAPDGLDRPVSPPDPPTAVEWPLPRGSDGSDLLVRADFGDAGPTVARGRERTLGFAVENRRSVPWRGDLALDTPGEWPVPEAETVEIPPGGQVEWTPTLSVPDRPLSPTQRFGLELRRRHDGSHWATRTVEVALVAAAHWRVSSPGSDDPRKIALPGSELALSEHLDRLPAGSYRAETALVSPEARRRRLIVHTTETVTARLNGETVIEDTERSAFLPAFHRCPPASVAEVDLAAGRNRLELAFDEATADAGVWVVPTATWETSSPGPVYALADVSLDWP